MENIGVVLKKGLDRLRALNEQMLKEAQKRRDKEPERIIEELSGVPPFAFGQDKQYTHDGVDKSTLRTVSTICTTKRIYVLSSPGAADALRAVILERIWEYEKQDETQ